MHLDDRPATALPASRRGIRHFVFLAWALVSAFVVGSDVAHARPSALAGLSLQDHRGKTLGSAELDNQVLVLNFVYTGCSSTCPLQTRELAELRRSLPPEVQARSRFLSVTVDPENDTPRTLAAYARSMGADLPGWSFAGGDPRQVNELITRMQALDVGRKPLQLESHRTSVYLYGRSGALVLRFAGVPLDRARLNDEIARAVRAAVPPPPSPSRHK